MRKHHPHNERIKHKYLIFLKEAKRLSESTVDQVASAIADFEQSTDFKDFKKFHIDQAQKYKRDLSERKNPKTNKPLAISTQRSRLMALKAFVQWLAHQPGYKSRVKYTDAEFFNPTHNEGRMAQAYRQRKPPTIDQIMQVLEVMPTETVIERRDKALIAFTLLSGARDSALVSLSLKHVDFDKREVFQDSREVKTKNRKTIRSDFFPVGEAVEQIVGEWIDELEVEHRFGPNDPLFPKTKVARDQETESFKAVGIEPTYWQSAGRVRHIFRQSFELAGLPYFNPHSFRKTLVVMGERVCKTPKDFKAWSQNLGHNGVLTTFESYGHVPQDQQKEVFRAMRDGDDQLSDQSLMDELHEIMRRRGR